MNEINKLEQAFKDMNIEEKVIKSEIIPVKCLKCHNNTICNPLLTYLTLYKIGIKSQVEACPYFKGSRND